MPSLRMTQHAESQLWKRFKLRPADLLCCSYSIVRTPKRRKRTWREDPLILWYKEHNILARVDGVLIVTVYACPKNLQEVPSL